jgi:flagella synthesis protein FlgN
MTPALQAELNEALAAVVADMQATATGLQQALAEERQALHQADPAALNRAGDAKQSLLRQLEQLDAERLQLLREAGTPDAMRQTGWDQVLRMLQACQRDNQRNGSIIGQRMRHVRKALSVLTGSHDEAGTYDPAGLLRHGHRSLPLAQT